MHHKPVHKTICWLCQHFVQYPVLKENAQSDKAVLPKYSMGGKEHHL